MNRKEELEQQIREAMAELNSINEAENPLPEYKCPRCGSKYFRTHVGLRFSGDTDVLKCRECGVSYWRDSGERCDIRKLLAERKESP